MQAVIIPFSVSQQCTAPTWMIDFSILFQCPLPRAGELPKVNISFPLGTESRTWQAINICETHNLEE